jgi:hypothetical protein
MQNALIEIRGKLINYLDIVDEVEAKNVGCIDKFHPDRIIIECSFVYPSEEMRRWLIFAAEVLRFQLR